MTQYILDKNKIAIPCNDVYEWGRWYGKATRDGSRTVERTELKGMLVSTVFLGVDHNFGEGDPLLFETMVFRVREDGEWDRGGDIAFAGGTDNIFGHMRSYSFWGDAVEGHKQAVESLKARFAVEHKVGLGNPFANKRRMRALWEIHYERLCTAKLEVDTRARAEPESGPVEAAVRPTRRRSKGAEAIQKAENHRGVIEMLKVESSLEDGIGLVLVGLTDQQAEDLVDWATAQGILTA